MIPLLRKVSLGFLVMALALLGACSKKGVDTAVVDGSWTLPGASEVKAALDKGDFPAVVPALGKVQAACTTEDQSRQYIMLAFLVRQQLDAAGATNAGAADAARMLRVASGMVR